VAYGSSRRIVVWFAIASPCLSGSGVAQERPPGASCTRETAARSSFLEERLEGRRRYADGWWKGWATVHGLGLVVEGTRAGFEDDRGERANQVVSAVKSSIGLARDFIDPPHAKDGADALRAIPATSREACEARLARAEELLRRNADEADERYSWKRHLANLGLNLAGAVIVAEVFDEPRGWASGALGFAVGEMQLWSQPWQARRDWEEYQRSFPGAEPPSAPPTTWRVVPSASGIHVMVEF
jgi:hypothetical protein